MLEKLSQLAEVHVADSNGLMELLPPDPERYPAQANIHITGEPNGGIIESIATVAEPRFSSLVEILRDNEDKTQEIDRIGQLLSGGNNVIIATNHGSLIDIALVEAAMFSQLHKQEYQFKTGIIIGKMVSMLAYRLGNESASCVDVLKILCNDIFLSFPRTGTVEKSGLSRLIPDEIERHNKSMRNQVRHRLNSGGMLLAVAPSGTTDKRIKTSPETYELGTLRAGTLDLLKHPKTYVLPVAIWLRQDQPFMKYCDIPRLIKTDEEAHKMMENISDSLNANVEGENFRYVRPNNLGRTALR
jgi:1-acyl-sn-glycerol-3-phosphate acyltransferase